MDTFEAEVTCYIPPNGMRKIRSITLPKTVRHEYDRLILDGRNFGCEYLNTGAVSLTLEDRPKQEDVNMRLIFDFNPETDEHKIIKGYVEMLQVTYPNGH